MERHHHATANIAISNSIDPSSSSSHDVGNALSTECFPGLLDLSIRKTTQQDLNNFFQAISSPESSSGQCSSSMMYSSNPLPNLGLFSSDTLLSSSSTSSNPLDSSNYIQLLMSSIPCLKSATGIVPHVSTASCLPPTFSQQIISNYEEKVRLSSEQPNAQKRIRVEGNINTTQINQLQSPRKFSQAEQPMNLVQQSSNATSNRAPSVEMIDIREVEQRDRIVRPNKKNDQQLLTAHSNIPPTSQTNGNTPAQISPANGILQLAPQQKTEQKPQLTSAEQSILSETISAYYARVTEMYITPLKNALAERDRLLAKLKAETQASVYIFTKLKKDVRRWEPSQSLSMEIFRVVYQGTAEFSPNKDASIFATQILENLHSIKKKTYTESVNSSLSTLTVSDYEVVTQAKREQVKINHATILAICRDAQDRNFFCVVYNPFETIEQVKIAVFCTHTGFVANEIMKTIFLSIMGDKANPRMSAQSFFV